MKVLVCGGRDYLGKQRLFAVLDALHKERPITLIIHGGAPGADSLGGRWAAARGIRCKVYRADWKKHGKAAGFIRNREMLVDGQPDLVVAFPGGNGTANTVGLAREAGVELIEDHGPPLEGHLFRLDDPDCVVLSEGGTVEELRSKPFTLVRKP